MRRLALIAAVAAIGASVMTAGCGTQQTPGTGQAGSGSPDPASSGPAAPAASPSATAAPAVAGKCVTPKLNQPARTFTITNADSGKSFCVLAGTGIYVFLRGTPAHMWMRIQPSSAVIEPRASGVMTLIRGVTGGFFAATRLGVATLSSTIAPCHAAPGKAAPGVRGCSTATIFRVTVLVRGRM
jgi:hypothetical protein